MFNIEPRLNIEGRGVACLDAIRRRRFGIGPCPYAGLMPGCCSGNFTGRQLVVGFGLRNLGRGCLDQNCGVLVELLAELFPRLVVPMIVEAVACPRCFGADSTMLLGERPAVRFIGFDCIPDLFLPRRQASHSFGFSLALGMTCSMVPDGFP